MHKHKHQCAALNTNTSECVSQRLADQERERRDWDCRFSASKSKVKANLVEVNTLLAADRLVLKRGLMLLFVAKWKFRDFYGRIVAN